MLTVRTGWLSIYIGSTEVYYVSFPRFHGSYCDYSTLDSSCKEQFDKALENAREVAKRFNDDGRFNASSEELQKAFNRNW